MREEEDTDSASCSSGAERTAKRRKNSAEQLQLVAGTADSNASRHIQRDDLTSTDELSILTFNLWHDNTMVEQRMKAISQILHDKGYPDILCFQEVSYRILCLFEESNLAWWDQYYHAHDPGDPPEEEYFNTLLLKKSSTQLCESRSSPDFCWRPFTVTNMGRGLLMASATTAGSTVFVACTHLESPMGPKEKNCSVREQQMSEALRLLDKYEDANILFAGDMNWLDEVQGEFEGLPNGWVDAWLTLKPKHDKGYTYDAHINGMLRPYNQYRSRLDRVYCRLKDWQLKSVEILGMRPIPGICKVLSGKGFYRSQPLRIHPSDHFGVLVTMSHV